jgi:protein-disulfide isomerase
MRLTLMTSRRTSSAVLATVVAAATLFTLPLCAVAQNAAPPGTGDHFKDTSPLKLPAGEKAEIYEFEDLECPACAHAFPIVHTAVEHYKIPLVRHDFPLQQHLWSRQAAINARYLQDKVSPGKAEEYRRDVFANQNSIASKDDLAGFTRKWFQTHSLQMPFVMDPNGLFAAEVQADYRLGERIGLEHTPSIFVLAPDGWTQVTDVTQLYTVIDQALAETQAHNNVRKPKTATR